LAIVDKSWTHAGRVLEILGHIIPGAVSSFSSSTITHPRIIVDASSSDTSFSTGIKASTALIYDDDDEAKDKAEQLLSEPNFDYDIPESEIEDDEGDSLATKYYESAILLQSTILCLSNVFQLPKLFGMDSKT
jgi:hypothetical protein